jgi:hypothetical protein
MNRKSTQYTMLILLIVGILAIFVTRTFLAPRYEVPRFFDMFDTITAICSFIIMFRGYRSLKMGDWIIALSLGIVVGLGMVFSSLYSPYPFFGVVHTKIGLAVVRGIFTMLSGLGGLVIMRQGGPIQFHAANGDWKKTASGAVIGLAIGLPIAILNVFALQFTQGQAILWQNPFAALLDALQPGIVEEVVYRFALWGLLWLALRNSLPQKAGWIAGVLALLIHNYAHFDELFVQSPFVALGMGLVLGLIWGFPPFLLAKRRGLESAVTFHWIQDVARFLAGF